MRYTTGCLILASFLGMGNLAISTVAAGPGRPPASVEMAWGRRDMDRGHWTGALSHFRKALGRDSRSSDAYAGIGRAYRRLGDTVRSKEAFTAALKINPHNDAAETGLHDVMSPDEHEKMMADIETRAKNNPRDADLQATYAEELFERDRFDEAAKAAQAALALNGRESHAVGVLGLIALQQNRKDDAARLLVAATQADESDDDSWAGLGDLYAGQRDYPRAVASYRHAVTAAPDHAEWHEKLSAMLKSAGDDGAAAAELQAARQIRDSINAAGPSVASH